MIRTTSLTKTFGDFVALKGISLEVEEGDIYGFIGPNGAGKTTTIKILTTLLEPTGGDAWVDGKSVWEDKEAIRLFHPGVVGDRRVRIDGEAGRQANGDLFPGTHGRGGAIVVGETRPRFPGFAVDVVGPARLDGLSGIAGS